MTFDRCDLGVAERTDDLGQAGVFKADTVLAKHDETYMPKDVADALKKQGHWKNEGVSPDVASGKAANTDRKVQ